MAKKGGKRPPAEGGGPQTEGPKVLIEGDPEFAAQTAGDREASAYVFDDGSWKLTAIDIAYTPMQAAYDEIEAILQERSKNIVAAFVSNVSRKTWRQRWADRAAGTGTAVVGIASGDPFFMLAFAFAGAAIALGRDAVDLVRIRWADKPGATAKDKTVAEARQVMLLLARRAVEANPHGDTDGMFQLMPALPEFQNLWVRSSWRLCHLIRCYNVRAGVINDLFRDATMGPEDVRAAKRMAMMMIPERTRLLRIRRTLEDYCAAVDPKVREARHHARDFTALMSLNARIDKIDLFGDLAVETKRNLTPIDWLALPQGILLKAEVAMRLKGDLQTIGYIREVDVTALDRELAVLEAKERARARAEKAAAEALLEAERASQASEADAPVGLGPEDEEK